MMRIKNVDEGAALMLASALMQALCFRVAVNLKYPELPRPDHEVRHSVVHVRTNLLFHVTWRLFPNWAA